MEKIKIYAPVDCIAHNLEELNDGIFSTGMLGNGFWIEPLSGEFYSPLENSKLSLVTDTKHAYFFEINENVNILMHIGLDTVKLNGEPFTQYVNLGDKVNLETKIVDVDLQSIKEKGYAYSCPITIDNQDKSINYEFKFENKTSFKKGELIGTFSAISVQEKVELKVDLESYFSQKDFYSQLAYKLNKLVGTKDNYTKVYNCMTRLRFSITNKSNVKESEIKETEGVKGIIWNGPELQIVIGQDVYKVKDEVIKLNNAPTGNFAVKGNNQKAPLFKRFFGVIGGIMVPLIPLLIAAGMMMGIVAILQISKIMPNILYQPPQNGILPEGSVLLKDANVFWAILKVVSDAPLKFLGLFAAITASNYFGLSPIIGAGIGLIIANPILFDGGKTQNGLYGMEWTLFETGINGDLNENPAWYGLSAIKVMPFTSRPFVIIFAIYLANKLDLWVKNWIKPSFETVFRPLIVIFTITMLTFFILGPIYYVIEQVISAIIYYLTLTPFGMSQAILSLFWPLLVMMGMHLPIATIINVAAAKDGGVSFLIPATNMTQWGCLGAIIGLVIISKNTKTKNDAIAALPSGVFGITEPAIYGVLLPRIKPLLAACLGAACGGLFIGLSGVTTRVSSGLGIFSFFGFFSDPIYPEQAPPNLLSNASNGTFFILAALTAVGCAIAFSMLLHVERIKENSLIRNLNRKIVKFIKLENILNEQEFESFKEEIKKLKFSTNKENLKELKEIEKQVLVISNLKEQYSYLIRKDKKIKDKLLKEGKKLIENKDFKKAQVIYQKHIKDTFKDKKENLVNKIKEHEEKLNLNLLDNIEEENIKLFSKALKDIDKKYNLNLKEFENNYINAIQSLKIYYEFIEPKTINKSIELEIKSLKETNKKPLLNFKRS